MAPSIPPLKGTTSSTESVSVNSAQCDYILKNFRQEDVIFALVSHLREREAELKKVSDEHAATLEQHVALEQSRLELQSILNIRHDLLEEKDSKIRHLEHLLAQKDSTASLTEDVVTQLTNEVRTLTGIQEASDMEHQRALQARDDDICRLLSKVSELRTEANILKELNEKTNLQHFESLEKEFEETKRKLALVTEENLSLQTKLEEFEKKVKGKEWVIKSLHEDNDDQRSRESHLLMHIRGLKETIESYEAQFIGKGVDVPMLLAKLKDSEERTRELESQLKQLTTENKKLCDLASRKPDYLNFDDGSVSSHNASCQQDTRSAKSITSNASLAESYEHEEDATLNTNVTEIEEQNTNPESDDVFNDFVEDVKVGIESIQTEGFCMGDYNALCANEPLDLCRDNIGTSGEDAASPNSNATTPKW